MRVDMLRVFGRRPRSLLVSKSGETLYSKEQYYYLFGEEIKQPCKDWRTD